MQNQINKFGYVATLIGFIVDTITIAGLMISLNQPDETGIWLTKKVMPWLALSIWVLAVFTYIAMIEAFRQKHYPEIKNLRLFAKGKLFSEFKHPFLLFPTVISIISYFWIMAYLPWITDANGKEIPLAAIIFSLLFIVFLVGLFAEFLTPSPHNIIEENWDQVSKTIDNHLKNKWSLRSYNLKTSLTWLKISSEDAEYAMALYASKFPKKAIYATYHFEIEPDPDDSEDDGWRSGIGLLNLKTVPDGVLF